jgi:hypothetical protein
MNFGSSQPVLEEIPEWDIEAVKKRAIQFINSHGVFPASFQFLTKVSDDGKVLEKSGNYFINGIVKTYEEVQAENINGENDTILWNMKYNRIKKIVDCHGWVDEFEDGDELVSIEI